MSRAIALPMPRRIRLPRIKFKRPRLPRGNPFFLAGAVAESCWMVYFALQADLIGIGISSGYVLIFSCLWWRSRGDGPGTT